LKVFISLGTTPFPELIEAVVEQQLDKHFELVVQHVIPQSEFKTSFVFEQNIHERYEWDNLVVTHAGTGTVFNVLVKEIKLLVVPNMSRSDPHQLELVNYLVKSNLCNVSYQITQLKDDITATYNKNFDKYLPDEFCGAKEIVNLLL